MTEVSRARMADRRRTFGWVAGMTFTHTAMLITGGLLAIHDPSLVLLSALVLFGVLIVLVTWPVWSELSTLLDERPHADLDIEP